MKNLTKTGLKIISLLSVPVICIAELSQEQRGELLYKQFQCHICHGEAGAKPAEEGYPVLAGQNKTYLVRQLIDIRDGVRDTGQSRLMRPLIISMSDSQADAIGSYLSASETVKIDR